MTDINLGHRLSCFKLANSDNYPGIPLVGARVDSVRGQTPNALKMGWRTLNICSSCKLHRH